MNLALRHRDLRDRNLTSPSRAGLIDCDIHPAIRTPADVAQFLPAKWAEHHRQFPSLSREPLDATAYPRISPATSRTDTWPPNGGPPGSNLDFMRMQHLDANGVDIGILIPLATKAADQRNIDYGVALCHALNEWQVEYWLSKEPRLRGSALVFTEDPQAAAAEIEHRAADSRFVQILLQPRAQEPLGRKRYWPIYEAAVRAGLPLGSHIGGQGGHAVTGSGWPSYYMEDHHAHVHGMQAFLASLVLEGVFEQFPTLKVVLTEPGFGWAPPFCWRLDKHWQRFRDEVPHVKRPPSQYIRENVWFTTQPIEEPERPQDLLTLIEWVGADRLLFSTDYPHWDFDDPRHVFQATAVPKEIQAKIFRENAQALYRLD